jgi:hypothetical protein
MVRAVRPRGHVAIMGSRAMWFRSLLAGSFHSSAIAPERPCLQTPSLEQPQEFLSPWNSSCSALSVTTIALLRCYRRRCPSVSLSSVFRWATSGAEAANKGSTSTQHARQRDAFEHGPAPPRQLLPRQVSWAASLLNLRTSSLRCRCWLASDLRRLACS